MSAVRRLALRSWRAILPSSEAHASSHRPGRRHDDQELGGCLGCAVYMQRRERKLPHSSPGVLLHRIITRLPDVALLPKYLMLWPVLKPPVYCPHASQAAESP